MTLKQIHAMFAVGQTWEAVNTYRPKASGRRELVQKLTTQLVWKTETSPRSWMTLPKAAEIIEARDGYLCFLMFPPSKTDQYPNVDPTATITLTRIEAL